MSRPYVDCAVLTTALALLLLSLFGLVPIWLGGAAGGIGICWRRGRRA